jgi:hypothetical protein
MVINMHVTIASARRRLHGAFTLGASLPADQGAGVCPKAARDPPPAVMAIAPIPFSQARRATA